MQGASQVHAQRKRSSGRWPDWSALIRGLGIFVFVASAEAQVLPGNDINFAYSSWAGTGFYSLGGRNTLILAATQKIPWFEPNENRSWQINVLLPGTIGIYEDPKSLKDVGAITFVPGLEFIFPITENWDFKPFGQVGFGHYFSKTETVLVSGAGAKSLTVFPQKYGYAYELGISLLFANNSGSRSNAADNGFSRFEIGLNTRWPSDLYIFDRKSDLNFFVIYTEFLNDLEFFDTSFQSKSVRRIYKIGFAVTPDEAFDIFGFKFPGAGFNLDFGDNYFGIGWNSGFPF